MRARIQFLLLLPLCGWLLVAAVPAQPQPASQRLASIKHLMQGLVLPHFTTLEEAVKTPPEKVTDWQRLESSAVLLNEASFMLLDEERAPDAVWEKAVLKLRVGSVQAFEAVQRKDVDGLPVALKAVSTACIDCHAAHRQ
jgi:cytochrome c556